MHACFLTPLSHVQAKAWGCSMPLLTPCKNALHMQELLDSLDADLRYVIEVEGKLSMEDVENYDEVRAEIARGLEDLRDVPNRRENPLIYHLDVAAMYPNIILTNRSEPALPAPLLPGSYPLTVSTLPGKHLCNALTFVWVAPRAVCAFSVAER